MAPQDNLEHYEATEAQDLTHLLYALRPSARAVQVPPLVDLTIRAAIWQVPVQRQVITLLSLARRDLVQVIRQALTDNPLLEEVARAEDEHTPAGGEHAQGLAASADDLTDGEELYHSIWQECVPDGWDASGLPAQASAVSGASEHSSGSPEALVPDVIVRKVGQDYQVFLNDEGMPRLRLSATYRRLVREGQWGEPEALQHLDDKLRAAVWLLRSLEHRHQALQHLDDKLRTAVWLLRSLEHRHQTLLKVTTGLVTRQRDCLDHGLAHVKPLALMEVAEALGLHASTMHLVLTNKYLATAHGTIALTSFFQSGIGSSGGETMSSLTVKDRIKTLVAAEHPATPLTDQQLVEVLAAEHITIARRTVTTYRRGLQLPPAHRRQRISDVQVFCHACGTLRPIHGVPYGVPCRACGFVDPTPVVEIGTVAEKDTTLSMGPLAISDEEQRVRQALETHTRRWLTEPLLGDREEASEVPPEVEEAQRHRYLAWLEQTRKSPRMQEVSRLVKRALHTTATVLLTGERGAGKSHLARLLHDQGPRAKGPFITVNCTAIPETFLEAELFGDERGAVTGATQQQPGCLELAAGGTLFLQEIGAMSRVLQAKLLRVLQEKRFERLGGTETITTDARIVAATNQDLEQLIAEGRFRRDLFFRLNVYPIALPPLRERQEDLGPLTMFFLMRFSAKLRKEVRGVCEDAMGWLERYPWPGNVRELEAVIEQVVARCQGPTVTVQDLAQALRELSRVMS
jgi:transcriptional regulator with AAA-type ATPase domain/DNA-directed RNA polymerase specialized sigma54-like protein